MAERKGLEPSASGVTGRRARKCSERPAGAGTVIAATIALARPVRLTYAHAMRHSILPAILVLLLLMALPAASSADPAPSFLSDAPEEPSRAAIPFTDAPSYGAALKLWKAPEDVSAWIGNKFVYDMDRAKQFTLSSRDESRAEAVMSPSQLFERRRGVCVDLARFGVETVSQVAPNLSSRYLRVEFEPLTIGGSTFRFHWLALFAHNGELYFFADSKRPGLIAGPYTSTADFITDYERYRQRKIVAFQELDTYRRKAKAVRK